MNKQKRLDKETFLPPIPYKMKEFQNVSAKVTTHNTTKLHPKPLRENITKVNFDSNFKSVGAKNNLNEDENIYNIGASSSKEVYDDEIKIMGRNDYVISHVINKEIEKRNLVQTNRTKSAPKGKIENIKKAKSLEKNKQIIKGPTPKATELNSLLPKKVVNHIAENKNLDKVQTRTKEIKKEEEPFDHKHYGKIPDYISKFKQEAEDKKEAEKKQAEESKYPKGTRLISEEERIEMLDNLSKTKKEIESALFKLPITLRTLSMQNKKAELENKLNELDQAIDQFSKKKVFIKADN